LPKLNLVIQTEIDYLNHAQKVFNGIPMKDAHLQTAILIAYLRHREVHNALMLILSLKTWKKKMLSWNANWYGKNGWYEKQLSCLKKCSSTSLSQLEFDL
jgi:hypothetical protein